MCAHITYGKKKTKNGGVQQNALLNEFRSNCVSADHHDAAQICEDCLVFGDMAAANAAGSLYFRAHWLLMYIVNKVINAKRAIGAINRADEQRSQLIRCTNRTYTLQCTEKPPQNSHLLYN